jgi:CDP-2,3-bis-(O-geranylgeranyl)-sn-glycerol synthase
VVSTVDILSALYFFVPAYLANMSPVLIRGHWEMLAKPLDAGRSLGGKRIFGDHKIWRGVIAALLTGVAAYEAQRLLYVHGVGTDLGAFDYSAHPVVPGLLMGLGAMVGDAVKSFFKRRVGIAPGASWPVFDQIDFLIGAYVFVVPVFAPPPAAVAACVPVVMAGAIATTIVGYGLGLKEAWI